MYWVFFISSYLDMKTEKQIAYNIHNLANRPNSKSSIIELKTIKDYIFY